MILLFPVLALAAAGVFLYQASQATERTAAIRAEAPQHDRTMADAYGARLTQLIEQNADTVSRDTLRQLLGLPNRADLRQLENGRRPLSAAQRLRICAFYELPPACFDNVTATHEETAPGSGS